MSVQCDKGLTRVTGCRTCITLSSVSPFFESAFHDPGADTRINGQRQSDSYEVPLGVHFSLKPLLIRITTAYMWMPHQGVLTLLASPASLFSPCTAQCIFNSWLLLAPGGPVNGCLHDDRSLMPEEGEKVHLSHDSFVIFLFLFERSFLKGWARGKSEMQRK